MSHLEARQGAIDWVGAGDALYGGQLMASNYTHVTRGAGTTAGITAASYIIASSMALSDGIDAGVEVPRFIGTIAVMVIVCCTILSGVAWIVDRSHRYSADRHIRPLVRDELDKAITAAMPLVVASVVESLDRRLVPQMHDVAVAAGRHSAVVLRDCVTQDLREIAGDLHRRAVITGQTMQANATGEALGRKALRSIPTHYVSTSRED